LLHAARYRNSLKECPTFVGCATQALKAGSDLAIAIHRGGSVMVHYSINPKKTALLVFDMLNDFIKPGAPLENPDVREQLIPRLKPLIGLCRSRGIPVIYACQAHRRDGSDAGLMAEIWPSVRERRALIKGTEGVEVYEEIRPQEGDIVIEKRRYSAFYNTDLELILKNRE
jgi:ureidoacrylate peracid hydrolase